MKLQVIALTRNIGLVIAGLMMTGAFTANNACGQISGTQVKPRIVVTCDPELDDNNSLIRFLLYSDGLQVEGLIYASSGYHWSGDGKGTKWYVPNREYSRFGLNLCPCESWRWAKNERFIHNAVEAYEKVYPNLKVHDADYPTPEYLKSKIRYGNIEFDGDFSKDSPGSDLIRALILDDKPGQLYITAWGGQSTIARALKSIQDQYRYTAEWDMIKKKISRKVVLLPSGDQDDTYATYIKPNWPDIEYREFKGGPIYGFGAQLGARKNDSIYMTAAWTKENISDRGPLGALYRVWGDGKQMVKGDKLDFFGLTGYTPEQLKQMGYIVWMPLQAKGSWIGEGDSGTFMDMLGNGLEAYETNSPGGWGGRIIGGREPQNNPLQLPDAASKDTSAKAMANALSTMARQAATNANGVVYPDFFPAAQLDFAARLKWSVTPVYANANHAPVIKIEGPQTVIVSAGQKIRVNAAVSDLDGNAVSIKWWQFLTSADAKNVTIADPASAQTEVTIPKDAVAGQMIYMILEATDNGTPAITRYQRVNIMVKK
jgi:hypothetical protein